MLIQDMITLIFHLWCPCISATRWMSYMPFMYWPCMTDQSNAQHYYRNESDNGAFMRSEVIQSYSSVYTGQTIVDPKQLMKDLKLEVADIKGAHACMLHRFCAAVHELAHLFTLRYKYCQVMCAWQMDCLWHACMNCMHAYTMHYINYNRGPGECAVERVRKYSAQWILPSGLAQRQGLL